MTIEDKFSQQQLIMFLQNGIIPFKFFKNEEQFNMFVSSKKAEYNIAKSIQNYLDEYNSDLSDCLFVSRDHLTPFILFDGKQYIKEILILPHVDFEVFRFMMDEYAKDIKNKVNIYDHPKKYDLLILANEFFINGNSNKLRSDLLEFYIKNIKDPKFNRDTFEMLLKKTKSNKNKDIKEFKDGINRMIFETNRLGDVITVYRSNSDNDNNLSIWKLSYLSAVSDMIAKNNKSNKLVKAEININSIYLYCYIRNEVILDNSALKKIKTIDRQLLKYH